MLSLQVIIKAYREACTLAIKKLTDIAVNLDAQVRQARSSAPKRPFPPPYPKLSSLALPNSTRFPPNSLDSPALVCNRSGPGEAP